MAQRTRPLPQITRERLKAANALRNLEWVESELRSRYQSLDLAEVPGLREYARIQMWKLDKVLPALKAVELSGQVDQRVTVLFNPQS